MGLEYSAAADPRLLLIDMTPISGSAATSTLKRAFFGDWREDALLHVQGAGYGMIGLAAGASAPRPVPPDAGKTRALVEAFRPEVILYRPVADHPQLHRFAMDILNASPAPLVMWIMDDWPERLREQDPARFAAMDADLRTLFARSTFNFAISDGMANAFEERYGAKFDVAHNGVAPEDWPVRTRSAGGAVKVRYAGSLAPDTTKESVLAAARVIEQLAAEGRSIIFEGRTQQYWFEQFGQPFNELSSVSMRPATMTTDEYRQWLTEADIILIAYNFDEATRRYLRYSFANKTPEALAAGAAILAFGPSELETIAFLQSTQAAKAVTQNEPGALAASLRALADDPERRARMGAAGRALAFAKFNLDDLRGRMKRALCAPVMRPPALQEETLRKDKAQFDECGFVFEILAARDCSGAMIDVGAHHGGSLAPFAKAGWRVWAFEPDPNNCKVLQRKFGRNRLVRISPNAVGAREQKNVALFNSTVSSGITTLAPFHESHTKCATVDVVTVDQVVEAESIEAVEFLKIDVEGFEMDVLKGLDLERIRPRAIMAEFEDAKTRKRGYTVQDLIGRLAQAGYVIYVSEWHPIERYGVQHSWRRLRKHPCEIPPDAWGNLIAFREDPSPDAIEAGFQAARSGGSAGNGALATVDLLAPASEPSRSPYRKVADWLWRNHPRTAGLLRTAIAPLLNARRKTSGAPAADA